MTHSLNIHTARPEEMDAVSRLIVAAYEQYKKDLPEDAWKNYSRDIADVRSRLDISELIVAELDGRPVGAVTYYPDASLSEGEGWPRGWAGIRILSVDPGYRDRGIGRALMEECLERSRNRGIRTVALHTSEMMEVALGMYQHMGFKRAPEYDFHPRPDVTVMAYRLDL